MAIALGLRRTSPTTELRSDFGRPVTANGRTMSTFSWALSWMRSESLLSVPFARAAFPRNKQHQYAA
jgi:hypothetical protein